MDIFGSRKKEKAAKRAEEMYWEMYERTREDLAPWREQGAKSLADLATAVTAGPGPLEQDPGYQFRYNEGKKAMRALAAREGTMNSSSYDRGLIQYGQNMASQEYGNQWDRYQQRLGNLTNLASMGQSAAAQTGAFGQTAVEGMADSRLDRGQAQFDQFHAAQEALNDISKRVGAGGLSSLGNAFKASGYAGQSYGGNTIGNGWVSAPR